MWANFDASGLISSFAINNVCKCSGMVIVCLASTHNFTSFPGTSSNAKEIKSNESGGKRMANLFAMVNAYRSDTALATNFFSYGLTA